MTGEGNRRSRASLLAILLLVGVFVAGGIAGAAANRLLEAREVVSPDTPGAEVGRTPRDDGSEGRGGTRRGPSSILQRRLELTDEQRTRVEAVFRNRRARTEAILREVEPRIQAQRDSTDLEIRALLTEDQRARYDEMVSRRRDGVRNFRGPPPGPP